MRPALFVARCMLPLVLALLLQTSSDGQRLGEFQSQVEGLPGIASADFATADRAIVALPDEHRIVTLDLREGRKLSFGELGSADGQLRFPRGAAVAPSGRIFVSDTGNDRVQSFEPSGAFLHRWGNYGPAENRTRRPSGIDANADYVAVADTGNDCVRVYDHDGLLISTIGGPGTDPARFHRPLDVAFDEEGHLWVADSGNHRIQRVTRAGASLAVLGAWGPGDGLFSCPSGVDVSGERVFVVDRDNQRVQVFDLAGRVQYVWGVHALEPGEGEGRLHFPVDVAVSPDGSRAIVCEPREDRLQVFGPARRPPDAYRTDPLLGGSVPTHFGPRIAARGDWLALVEPEDASVLLYDTTLHDDPVLTARLGLRGSGPGRFQLPGGLAFDAAGRLWASDSIQRSLSEFRIDAREDAERGFDPSRVRLARSADLEAALAARGVALAPVPGALAIDAAGQRYVIDELNAQVLVLDPSFDLLFRLGARGSGERQFRAPVDLALAQDGEQLYVADAALHRVLVFDRRGRFVRAWGEPGRGDGQFHSPSGVATDASGRVYVADAGNHRVQVFDGSGAHLATWGGPEPGVEAHQLRRPAGIAVDGRGRVVVVDHGNHRLLFFDREGELLHAFGPRPFVAPALAGTRSGG